MNNPTLSALESLLLRERIETLHLRIKYTIGDLNMGVHMVPAASQWFIGRKDSNVSGNIGAVLPNGYTNPVTVGAYTMRGSFSRNVVRLENNTAKVLPCSNRVWMTTDESLFNMVTDDQIFSHIYDSDIWREVKNDSVLLFAMYARNTLKLPRDVVKMIVVSYRTALRNNMTMQSKGDSITYSSKLYIAICNDPVLDCKGPEYRTVIRVKVEYLAPLVDSERQILDQVTTLLK